MDFFDNDISGTGDEFEFTNRIVARMDHLVSQAEEDLYQEPEEIFHYLTEEMELVSFKDHLKRYIYKKAELKEAYQDVPDEVYINILIDGFQQNRVPYSFGPTKPRLRATVKQWFGQSSPRRNSFFLIGFALRMPNRDVSEFLTKALLESDFDFSSPEECIYWHCYHKGLPYSRALELQEVYQKVRPEANENLRKGVLSAPSMYLSDETMLIAYLQILKGKDIRDSAGQKAYAQFRELIDANRIILAEAKDQDEGRSGDGYFNHSGDIKLIEVETAVCSGIPRDRYGNLVKVSRSRLSKQFSQKRLTRQRISKILKREIPVDRFDLITLLFCSCCSGKYTSRDPVLRYRDYVEQINERLNDCGMMEIYPVNPYEAFILMCLLTEDPLETYEEIMAMSYAE